MGAKSGKRRRIRAPRGTADVFPDRMRLVRGLEQTARRVLENAGYGELRTPTFEQAGLFTRGIGEATDIVEKEMYLFAEEDGDSFALRPEGTASVVRAYIQRGLDRSGGFTRLYYIGPMFRRERPQAGRMREFYQIGAEALGSAEPTVDAEMISLAMRIFAELGLEGCQLKVNTLGCLACRAAYRDRLKEILFPLRARLCEDCRRRLNRNVFRVLDCKNESCRRLAAELPPMREYLDDACRSHFERVLELLDAAQITYHVDDRLARGFDYYTRTVWEVGHPSLGARDAICGGGRYDNLVEQMGGGPTGASGFSIGEVPTLLALEKQGVEPSSATRTSVYLVAIDDACRTECFRLAHKLRATGIRVETDPEPRSARAQMRAANRSGAAFAGVIGPEELTSHTVKLKDMTTGEERSVATDRLPDALRNRRPGSD